MLLQYKFRNYLTVFAFSLSVILFGFSVNAASFEDTSGLKSTGQGMGYSDSQRNTPLIDRFGGYLGLGMSFIGVIFLVMAIYAGFLWMNAQGNEKEVEKAKTILTEVVIGVTILTSAYIITRFVGGAIAP